MRRKLTLTVEESIIENAKKKAKKQGISLSKIVEKVIEYYGDPHVYCFRCGIKFRIEDSKICTKCGWYICPECGACVCVLDRDSARVAFYMRKTLIEIFSTVDV